jgi:hypothetical protein
MTVRIFSKKLIAIPMVEKIPACKEPALPDRVTVAESSHFQTLLL